MSKAIKPAPSENLTIYLACAAIMQDIKAIERLRENTQQKFWFRGIDDVMSNLHPIFAAHGVIVVPEIVEDSHAEIGKNSKGNAVYCAKARIKYSLFGPLGDSISGSASGVAFDSADKAMPKAMTMAYKSWLCQTFIIPTYDTQDADSYDPTVHPRGENEFEDVSDEEIAKLIEQTKGAQMSAAKNNNPDELKECVARRQALEDEQQRRAEAHRKANPPKKETTEKAEKAAPKETAEDKKAAAKEQAAAAAASEPGDAGESTVAANSAPASDGNGDWREVVFDNLPIAKWNGVKMGEIPADIIGKMKRGWVDKFADNIALDPVKKATALVILQAHNELFPAPAEK